MERVKCLKCGRAGYTASPEKAPCDHCGASYKDIRLSYKVMISAASMYASDGVFKLKINVSVAMFLEDKVLFFVNNLTFCSLNEAERFNYTEFLRNEREGLFFKHESPSLANEAAYLYIIGGRLHGGAS